MIGWFIGGWIAKSLFGDDCECPPRIVSRRSQDWGYSVGFHPCPGCKGHKYPDGAGIEQTIWPNGECSIDYPNGMYPTVEHKRCAVCGYIPKPGEIIQ